MVSESGADEAELFKSYATLRPIDSELAEQMLREAKAIMDRLGVSFFLRQGTCLGAIRDEAFIPWDDDIDLGCVIGLNGFTEDLVAPVLDGFRDQGYFVNAESNDRWVAAGMIKSSLRIDLTFFRMLGNSIFHFPMIWMPARLFANLKEIEFMGGKYLVPNPPEEYLRTKYGPSWTTPKEVGMKRMSWSRSRRLRLPTSHPARGRPQLRFGFSTNGMSWFEARRFPLLGWLTPLPTTMAMGSSVYPTKTFTRWS